MITAIAETIYIVGQIPISGHTYTCRRIWSLLFIEDGPVHQLPDSSESDSGSKPASWRHLSLENLELAIYGT